MNPAAPEVNAAAIQAPVAWHARAGAILLALAIVALLALGIGANASLRALLVEAWGRMRVAPVLAVLPLQAAAIWLCSVALWLLNPGVSAGASFESRLLRDAGNNMLLILPGLGEAIGARVMVLAGGRPRAAVTVRALDILAEIIGQLPYMAIALVVLSRVWRRVGLPVPDLRVAELPGWSLLVVLAIAGGLALASVLAWRWVKGAGRKMRPVRRLRAEYRLLAREVGKRRRVLPLAAALHVVAWGISGVQIWLAARLFGLPLGLGAGIAIESAASTVRVLLFFVPGGLVMQEAGIVGAGLAFGLAPAASLALALVLRLRDLFFGLALFWWPVLEYQARRRKS